MSTSAGDDEEDAQPLFNIFVVPEDDDGGPLSAPPEDFPIGSHVRLQDKERCRRIMGTAWLPWMDALASPDMFVELVRHMGQHTMISTSLPPTAFGLAPVEEDDAIEALQSARGGRDSLRVRRGSSAGSPTPNSSPASHTGASARGTPSGARGKRQPFVPGSIRVRVPLRRTCLVPPRMSQTDLYPSNNNTNGGGQSVGPLASMRRSGGAPLSTSLSVTLQPNTHEMLVELKALREAGNAKYRERNVDGAIQCYSAAVQLIERIPDLRGSREHVRTLNCRAGATYQARRLAESFADSCRLIDIAAEDICGYVRAGHVRRYEKQFSEAEAFYRRAAKIDPSNPEVLRQREANSLAAVVAATPPPGVDIIVDPSMVTVVTKSRYGSNQRMFTEAPLASVVLDCDECADTRCSHCHASTPSQEELIRRFVEHGLPSTALERARNIVGLAYREGATPSSSCACGRYYCNERCRSAAWDEYHFMECEAEGRWATGMQRVNRLLLPGSPIHGVLKPHAVRLVVRLLAVFLHQHAASRSNEMLLRFFRPRLVGPDGPLLTPNEREAADRVREELSVSWCSDTRRLVSQRAFHYIFDFVHQSSLSFGVTPTARVEEVLLSHIGYLEDTRGTPLSASESKSEDAATHDPVVAALRTLYDLRAALVACAPSLQVQCYGAFRTLGLCQRSTERRTHSNPSPEMSDGSCYYPAPFIASQAGRSEGRGSPMPLGHNSRTSTAGSGGLSRQGSRSRLVPNAIVVPVSPSAVVGVGVLCSRPCSSSAIVVLDDEERRDSPDGRHSAESTPRLSPGVFRPSHPANSVP